ncbi:hypothetical protein O8C79_05135 [Aliarcobacter butzleri]|uniref:hypothetical protein n=1 Tax=Aliarcobacter butzleri TaxID=28197 RepID=UPI00263D7C9B|nr:hypothetical protein [Aliarcobacter butzleri]MDN5104677.1 hypothetical protein [Aliarcobacter butzleri]
MIIDFIKIHHKIIKEEIKNLPKWTLDLTTVSLHILLTNWNKDNDDFSKKVQEIREEFYIEGISSQILIILNLKNVYTIFYVHFFNLHQ